MIDLVKQKPSKRLDLQGIRGLAITVVLGFHFYPEAFPNGYLGVDQFFVLSGFLMCMLLKRSENKPTCSLVTTFYFKRFKRILPLYLLIILISMICLYNFFPDTAVETNQESANHALLFVSNRPKTDQEDYFQQLSIAIDIFTHTWSLSVEIQFYFLVPFIFIISTYFSEILQYGYFCVIAITSLVYFNVIFSTEAFNSVLARIWQFMIGMMVYLFSKSEENYQVLNNNEDEEVGECKKLLMDAESDQEVEYNPGDKIVEFAQKTSYILLTGLLLMTGFPLVLPPIFARPLVTIGTGCLMTISKDNTFLSNRVLTYIGDISYALYLIHWPIYAYWKLSCDGNQYLLVCALVSSFFLAVLVFETFEKWYLKLSSTSVGILVVALFFQNIVLINKDLIMDNFMSVGQDASSLDNVTDDMTLDDAARLNHRWSVFDRKFLRVPSCVYETKSHLGWCRHTGLSPLGKYKMAIIGNSWTANHARMFYQECGHKAKNIMQGAAYGCEALYPSTFNRDLCRQNFTHFAERIKNEKPDYAFIFTRYMSIGAPFPRNVTNFNDDPIYQIMKTQMLNFISNIKYKLYILDALPNIKRKSIDNIVPLIRNHTDFADIDNTVIKLGDYEMARKRYDQLVKDCNGKCVLVDYLPEFYNNSTGTFRYFDDKGFAYWTESLHLSPHGIEHIRHVWKDICSKL
ncbi:Acyl_transf_3 domain-containing protein [Caenorhabditis elegans]|uniref:Acyl_transf_3 domain-containing protein n=1 Tax=Caenorhabditis elegans TaxID=6239 RepID=O45884_CAEEL|nr:Acyl_transf_3 domain-containing protein [Caenorhabditis elegans]CCD71910.2 Acyl_transf_3 domain-containing protein [Caenorhabditis elegans]|eukprot:NP_500546.2 O-ACyltransferase homolog [Caenorhabditis elegans]